MDMNWEIKEKFPADDCTGFEIKVEIRDSFWIAAYNRPGETPYEVVDKIKAELEAVIDKYRI